MIQKPDIEFSDRSTSSLKEYSPNSYFFPDKNLSQKPEQYVRPKQRSLWQSRKMDHNLSYRGSIWVIQKPKIKFSDRDTIYLKDASPNSPFF